jgi:archaellum component FlaC
VNKHFLSRCGQLTALVSVFCAGAINAQSLTLQDINNARGVNGCWQIPAPWSDLRSECVSRQNEMENICKHKEGHGLQCGDLKIPDLIQSRKDLTEKLKEAKTLDRKSDVESFEKQLSNVSANLKGAQDEARRRRDVNKECATRRDRVMSLFTQVASKLDSTRSSTTDATARDALEKLKGNVDKSVEKHVEAVNRWVGIERDLCDRHAAM